MLDENFEIKVLACLYRSSEFCAVACQHLKPKYFESNLHNNMCKMSLDFYEKYKTPISQMGYVDAVKKLLERKVILDGERKIYIGTYGRLYEEDITDWKYVLDKLISFIKQSEIKLLIERAVTRYLPGEEYEAIEAGMREISNITSMNEVIPTAYFEAIDDRYTRREEEKKGGTKGIPTGIQPLDEIMGYRGWCDGELYAIAGNAKSGKSQALAFFANAASILNHKVFFFTLEVDTSVISDRLDAMNADIAINDLGMYNKDVVSKIKSQNQKGEIYIFDYPTRRMTVEELERQVRKMEIEKGVRADMIVVDYLSIMRSDLRGESWDKLERLAEDLRAVAKIFKVPVLTAAQLNRGSSGKVATSGADLSGAYAICGVVDGLITLGGSLESKERGELTVRTSEFRNCPASVLRIKTEYQKGKFFKELINEEF